MLRPILILHRWLGVVIGVLITVWCLSGFVMLYVAYPQLTPAERLQGLSPLHPPSTAALDAIALPGDMPLTSAQLEMVAGRAILRIAPAAAPASYDLATGMPITGLPHADIRAIAAAHGARWGIGPPTVVTATGIDQWTVQSFGRNRPLYRVDYADAAGTSIYISGSSGAVVQQTTRFERFWNWLGAVPHWLYPTLLRQNAALWAQVVVWTALIGCFLTATGLYVGVARLRRRDGHIGSPYRARLWWWHHMAGLFFGLLTLSWIASGLFSMNPWGFLDSATGSAERQRLAGTVRWGEVRTAIAGLGALPPGTVRLESAPLGGRAFTVAIDSAGRTTRFDAQGRAAPLQRETLAAALRNGPPLAALERIAEEDDYYYAHKLPVKLPVWRAVLADGQATRLYIDADSGVLIRAVDANGRGFRWLHNGLHSLDFAVLRARPLWDFVVLPLLAAVTFVCGTGAWMGLLRLGRDLRRRLRR